MELRFFIQTVIEILVAAALIYGLFAEDKWARFERKLFKGIKRLILKILFPNKTYTNKAQIIPFNKYELKRTCH